VDLGELRREYRYRGLSRGELATDPLTQFTHWFEAAQKAQLNDPTAMVLATVAADGQPSQRTVLLKYFDREGLVFFTNLESKKAREIAGNDRVSLLFPWYQFDRQVKVKGFASRVSTAQAARYFLSRPRDSQVAAWISAQSSPVSSRQMLVTKFNEFRDKLADGEMTVPKFWGGYRVSLEEVEFWQGRENRLHDRFVYTRGPDGWQIQRLAP